MLHQTILDQPAPRKNIVGKDSREEKERKREKKKKKIE
jgi:hypothetical protein